MPDFTLGGMSALLKGRLGAERYSPQIAAALSLAHRMHEGQFREQADPTTQPIPYIVHPVGVALLAAEFYGEANLPDGFDDVISVCLTHDLLEDTPASPHELERSTSSRTLELVAALSRPPTSSYSSHEDRNAAFLETIKAAGRTATFVKICDSMHNLSRPEQTPVKLLEKTLAKARRQYLPLLEVEDFGAGLPARYGVRLDEADALVFRAREQRFAQSGYDDIDKVFSHVHERAKRKELESHDVAEILKEVTGAVDVIHASLQDFASSSGFASSAGTLRLRESGEDIGFGALPETVRAGIAPAVRIVSVAPGTFIEDSKLFFVLLGQQAPAWVSRASLTVLASFLLERTVLRAAGQAGELSDAIRATGLGLDPHLAIEAGFGRNEIGAMADRFEAARAAKGILDPLLLGRLPPNVEPRVERRESRIKTPASLARKLIEKKIAIDQVEDIVGYRFVVRNLIDREKVVQYVLDALQKSTVMNDTPPVAKTIRTSRGYVAEHISGTCKLVGVPHQPVSVEIQVRTILDDAWARVSLAIDYKKNNVVTRRNDRILRKLRDFIDDIEKEL